MRLVLHAAGKPVEVRSAGSGLDPQPHRAGTAVLAGREAQETGVLEVPDAEDAVLHGGGAVAGLPALQRRVAVVLGRRRALGCGLALGFCWPSSSG